MKNSSMLLCGLGILFGFSVAMIISPATLVDFESQTLIKYDRVDSVACGSDSMGTVLNCRNKLYIRTDKLNCDQLEEGRIYTFKLQNYSVVHRLVYKDENCTKIIFKGDSNNVADEPVSLKNITGRVELIGY